MCIFAATTHDVEFCNCIFLMPMAQIVHIVCMLMYYGWWYVCALTVFGPQWVHPYALRAPVLLNIVIVLLNVSLNK